LTSKSDQPGKSSTKKETVVADEELDVIVGGSQQGSKPRIEIDPIKLEKTHGKK